MLVAGMFERERECTRQPKNLQGCRSRRHFTIASVGRDTDREEKTHGGDIGGNEKAQTGILLVCLIFVCPPADDKGFEAALCHHLAPQTLVKRKEHPNHEFDHLKTLVRRSRGTSEACKVRRRLQ